MYEIHVKKIKINILIGLGHTSISFRAKWRDGEMKRLSLVKEQGQRTECRLYRLLRHPTTIRLRALQSVRTRRMTSVSPLPMLSRVLWHAREHGEMERREHNWGDDGLSFRMLYRFLWSAREHGERRDADYHGHFYDATRTRLLS